VRIGRLWQRRTENWEKEGSGSLGDLRFFLTMAGIDGRELANFGFDRGREIFFKYFLYYLTNASTEMDWYQERAVLF